MGVDLAAKKTAASTSYDEGCTRYNILFKSGCEGFSFVSYSYLPISLMAACAAARRAMGTRKGLQDT